MVRLGVNIDHVATLREARRIHYPDPVEAAILCENAGCDSIVCHLREDRRHIKDGDVLRLRKELKKRFNLEMAIAKDIVDVACAIRPDQATLVPEKRKELTTEGGLDAGGNFMRIKSAVGKLEKEGIKVSLFIDPVKNQIDTSHRMGVTTIELHTGEYANARTDAMRDRQLKILKQAVEYASRLGLEVNAGHGLNYDNTQDVARISGINELNIGHSIVARAVFVGLEQAVREMLRLIR